MIRSALRLATLAASLTATPVPAETLRIATYDAGLSREGAGVLLRDLEREPDAQIAAALAVIRSVRPDVLLLTGIDTDPSGRAVAALSDRLRAGPEGIDFPHRFQGPVNSGVPSGRDIDGDGQVRGPDDARGWGRFPGNGGMAVLSRLPLDAAAARSFRDLLWADLPDALLPEKPDGGPIPDADSHALLPLSSRAHWDLPLALPDGRMLHLLASNPTPPAFDGPKRLNHRRNHDEIRFWVNYLDGAAVRDDRGEIAPLGPVPVVVLGNLNADPTDGDGLHAGIVALLTHPRLNDPRPASPGAEAAAAAQGGVNREHGGPSALDTADWRDDGGPGNLRVDYVLPSRDLGVTGTGVFWPAEGDSLHAEAAAASAHRMVWIDVALP